MRERDDTHAEEVFAHHAQSLGAGDLDGIVADYADDAIFITPAGLGAARTASGRPSPSCSPTCRMTVSPTPRSNGGGLLDEHVATLFQHHQHLRLQWPAPGALSRSPAAHSDGGHQDHGTNWSVWQGARAEIHQARGWVHHHQVAESLDTLPRRHPSLHQQLRRGGIADARRHCQCRARRAAQATAATDVHAGGDQAVDRLRHCCCWDTGICSRRPGRPANAATSSRSRTRNPGARAARPCRHGAKPGSITPMSRRLEPGHWTGRNGADRGRDTARPRSKTPAAQRAQ